MEFGEVGGEDGGRVTGWVACYEDWEEGGSRGGRGVDDVDHLGHFVEFFGTDVWAVTESEIYLPSKVPH